MATIAQKVVGLALVLEGYKAFNDGLEQSGEAIRKFNDIVGASQATTTMAAPVEKATVALTEFGEKWKALSEYFTGQKPPILDNEAWNRIGTAMEDASAKGIQSTTALAAAIADEVQKAKDLEEQTKALAAAQKAAEEQQAALNSAIESGSKAMLSLGKGMATVLVGIGMVASRIEELNNILVVTANNAAALHEEEAAMYANAGNVSKAQETLAMATSMVSGAVQEEVKQVRQLHLSGIVASEAVAQMIRYDLDWTRANELAREAQDAATYAMQDSSVAMNGLIQGIITLQPRLLRTYGIMINLDIAYAKWAAANGTAVKEMTVTQRQQAALNEVLAKAPSIAGAYEAAMGTAAKRVRSLKTDSVNLAEAYGQFLTPALNAATGGLRSIILGLTDLPDWLRKTIADVGSATTALLLFAGAAGTARAALLRLTSTTSLMAGLSAAAKLLGSALLGPGGVVVALGLVATGLLALKNAEEAHKKEAAAILAASESYDSYIKKLTDAGLLTYALSAGLYEVAKAADAATQEALALALDQATESMKVFTSQYLALANVRMMISEGKDPAEVWKAFANAIRNEIPTLEDNELAVLANVDTLEQMGKELGLRGTNLETFITILIAAAQREKDLRAEIEQYGKYAGEHADLVREQGKLYAGADSSARGLAGGLELVNGALGRNDTAYRKANEAQWQKIQLDKLEAQTARNAADAVWAQIDAAHQNALALKDLDYEYGQKKEDLWAEMNKKLADIDKELAKVHGDILGEMSDLDQEYADKAADALRDRNDAFEKADRDYQRDLENALQDRNESLVDADRDYQQDLIDAEQDRLDDIEDMERHAAEKREDMLRDLNQDLVDIETDHLERLKELENYRLELAKEYAEKRKKIEEDYAKQALDISKKYSVAEWEKQQRANANEERRKTLLDEIALLKKGRSVNHESGSLAIYAREQELAKLKEIELAELEKRKEEELSELEKWLREEEKVREQIYQEQVAEEQRRYEEKRAERLAEYQQDLADLQIDLDRKREEIQRDYERKLEDLKIHHEREREKIQRDYQQKLDDLARQHAQEEAEIQRNYQRKLEELAIQLEKERAETIAKLEEQRQDVKDKYAEQAADLALWYSDRKKEIAREYEEQRKEILYQLGISNAKAAEEFGLLPKEFQKTFDELQTQVETEMADWAKTIIDAINAVKDALQMHSKSKVMMAMGKDIMGGLVSGLESVDISKELDNIMGKDAFNLNVQAALGRFSTAAQTTSMPAGATAIANRTSNQNLSVTANYQRYQSESSLRDDLALYNMMLRARSQ